MSVETYGFAIYISAFALSVIWIGWAFIPDDIINCIGIIYYPSKYWAAASPSLIIVAYISWFLYYTIYVLFITAPRKNLAKCTDSFSKPFVYSKTSIPPLFDISIEAINKEYI